VPAVALMVVRLMAAARLHRSYPVALAQA